MLRLRRGGLVGRAVFGALAVLAAFTALALLAFARAAFAALVRRACIRAGRVGQGLRDFARRGAVGVRSLQDWSAAVRAEIAERR